MAFGHGKDTKVFISGYDLSTYFNVANTQMSADLAECSTFQTTYKQFVAGLLDSKMNFEGYFDPSTGAVDAVLTSLLQQNTHLIVLPQGDTQGNRGRGMYGVETNYETSSSLDGAVTVSMEAATKTGAEPIVVNCPKAAKSSTGNDASGVNGGAATTNSWAAFLQVFAVSGSSATLDVVLQDSADNSTFLDVTGGNFAQVLQAGVPTSQRIAGAAGATLRQYTRFKWTLGGSTPNFTIFGAHVRK